MSADRAATTAEDWIAALHLAPHPEGGFYRETYRSAETIAAEHLPPRFRGPRAFSTAILFLLRSGDVSRLHRIRSDEVWHFYAGSSVTLHVIEHDGRLVTSRLGGNLDGGETFQAVVPAGAWYGATVDEPDTFALVGETVAPGFEFADFELARRGDVLARYPQHRALIERLTR